MVPFLTNDLAERCGDDSNCTGGAAEAAHSPLIPSLADGVWGLMIVALVAVMIVGIVLFVRQSRRAIEPAARTTRSNADRLAELAALLAAGSITQAEHDTARARILSDL